MTIVRPLIGLRKRELIAFAEARRAPFVDDPSNADPRFARTRLRALLARLGEEGLEAEALDRLARRAGETEQALAHLTAEVEARLGQEEADRRPRALRSADRYRAADSRSPHRRGGRTRPEPDRA